jgi:peptidyl-prolyl cis-trans isomerase D
MAIRKFRQKIKPFIWVMTIAFVLSMGAVTISELKKNVSNGQEYAFKINGEKISKIEIERMKNNIQMNIGQQTKGQIDEELIEVFAISEVVNGVLMQEYSEENKIKVSDSEVNSEYKVLEKKLGKEQLARLLGSKGHTKSSYKKEIAKSLLISKILKTTAESPENRIKLEKEINKLKKEMIISNVSEQYKLFVPKTALENEGFAMENGDYSQKVIYAVLANGNSTEDAKVEVKRMFESRVKLAKKAIEKGVIVEEGLTWNTTFSEYLKGLRTKIGEEIKIDSKELEEYFKKHIKTYKIPATVDFEVAKIKLKDNEAVLTLKAEEIMKKILENKVEFDKLKETEPAIFSVDKYNSIQKEDYLSNIGKNQEELLKKVFASKLKSVNLLVGNDEILIYRKNGETKEVEPLFSENTIKNRVENDYKNEIIEEKLIDIAKTK